MRRLFTLALAWTALASGAAAARKPNIVFILTDNQGAWTLGCHGNQDILTPAIDRLAAEGFRFERCLSSNAVCSPTRATFLTGLIPSQHGLHCFLDPKFMMGPEACFTLAEFKTLPEVLSDAGYACGLSGKWHLGDNLKPGPGFSFWVTKPDGSTAEFYDQPIIENGEVRRVADYTTDYFTRRGIEFIEKNRDRPFFLFLAYNGPYNLGRLMSNPPRNRHADFYKDKPFHSFPRDAMHPWQHANKQFHNEQTAIERCAAETSGVDDGVGEVMAALERLGLKEDTIVVYTSDQGWMGGQNGIWGMGDHTRPIGAHDLMMHIPLIFSHPAGIPAGRTSDALISNYDFMPTLLGYLDLPMPDSPRSPGRDFSPLLKGGELPGGRVNEIFYEMENTRCLRGDRWKVIERFPDGPHEFYDLEADPRERFNLFNQPGYEEHQTAALQRLREFFAATADPQFDLWRGGRSKAAIHYLRH
jgi:choline-sulfatase